MDGIEILSAVCGPEQFRMLCKIHSPYTLLMMHYFASCANFRFDSDCVANPYHATSKNNPTSALQYRIWIASHEPNRHQALFTLKTLGQLLVQHQFKTGKISEAELKQAIKMWLYEDDEG